MDRAAQFLKLRDDFPMLKQKMHDCPLIYFDSAATTQKPQIVIDTIRKFYEEQYGTVHRAIYQLALFSTQAYHEARQVVRHFLNVSDENQVIFTKGTTEGINLVANCFGQAFIREGDEILVSQLEHHSNIVPWQLLCERSGAHLRMIPVNDQGELLMDQFEQLLSSKTKLICVGHVANSLGTLNPIEKITALAHASGAKVLVDAAQSAPHLPIDVQKLDVDFLVFSGHKTYGPTGVGVLYGKRDLLEKMPPYQGGGDMINKVTFSKTTYSELPLKFEAGTPMIAEVLGLAAALQYISKIGLDQIKQHENALLQHMTHQLDQIEGLKIIGQAKEKGAIISFAIEGIHPLDLGTLLDLKGVAIRTGHHCSQPALERFGLSSTSRISFGLYNSMAEIDQFLILLKECLRSLR